MIKQTATAMIVLCSLAWGQSAEEKPKNASELMRSAADRQRVSARKQAGEPSGLFFTVGWAAPIEGTPGFPPSPPLASANCDPVPATDLAKIVVDAAQREGINPALIRAIIRRESAGRPCAVSVKGAEGIMQLMPGTQADLGVRNPFDAADNVAGGARYLKQMLARYKGNIELALAAYNAGPQRVDDQNGVPEIPETQAYVAAILAELKESQEEASQ